MAPSPQEREQICALVERFEVDTGVQAVATVAAKADAYPDIPWKAYALGSGIGALAAAFNPFLVSGWSHASVLALDAMIILAAGVVLAALAGFVPVIGHLFLDGVRARAEALQYAQGLFLDHQLFRTKARRAVLVVLCHYERTGVVIVDTGLRQFAPAAALAEIGATSGRILASAGVVPAFEVALHKVKELLVANGLTASAGSDELADEVLPENPA